MDPSTTQVGLNIVAALGSTATVGIAGWIIKEVRTIKNRQKYEHFKLEAVDYALAQESKNGYRDHRDKKMDELLKRDEFVYEKGK